MNSAFFNLDAERAYLAAVLKDREAAQHIRRLRADDFYEPAHKGIFEALTALALADEPITLPAVSEALKRVHGSDELMEDYAAIITGEPVVQTWALKSNADIIRAAAQRRNLYKTLTDAREALCDGTRNTSEVSEEARQKLLNVAGTSHTRRGMIEGMSATIETLERRYKGLEKPIPTGLGSLDRVTSGLHRGELTIIGARPAVGKSALGVHMAVAAASAGYRVLVCSREMTEAQYHSRLLARFSEVSPQNMRSGKLSDDDWAQICDAASVCGNLPMVFTYSLANIEDLRSEVQDCIENGGLDVLVVDYLQLMRSCKNFEADYLRIGYVSRMLKEIAMDLNIAVVALAQVGRNSEGSMPTLGELRGSGDIEQDADNVIFLHRPEDAFDKCVRSDDRAMFDGALDSLGLRYIALGVAKQRQGETKMVAALFNPSKMIFTDINRGLRE